MPVSRVDKGTDRLDLLGRPDPARQGAARVERARRAKLAPHGEKGSTPEGRLRSLTQRVARFLRHRGDRG
jgi:hypothetical protein